MKLSFSLNRTSGLNYACAAVMLLMVVLLFVPFWNTGEQTVSINSYVWMPSGQTKLEAYFADALGEKVDINSVVTAPVLLLVLGVLGAALSIFKGQSAFGSLLGIPFGIVGIWGYATCPVLRLGSLWGLHLALCIAALALSVGALVSGLLKASDNSAIL